jgi:hypothetical protein
MTRHEVTGRGQEVRSRGDSATAAATGGVGVSLAVVLVVSVWRGVRGFFSIAGATAGELFTETLGLARLRFADELPELLSGVLSMDISWKWNKPALRQARTVPADRGHSTVRL